MRNRMLNRAYAKLHGFFWLPCPICSKEFGGHEWGSNSSIRDMNDPCRGVGICPDCKKAGLVDHYQWDEASGKAVKIEP